MKLYTADNKFGFTPESRVFAKVWEEVTKEYMREFNYTAECANLHFDFNMMHDNINFIWTGFNDSMPNYISETI
jgi:secreted Zn-dependent insulinase-like peptidase